MFKVWLIQNVLAPYRIPLFEEIAKRADFEFHVVVTAPKCHHRPHWTYNGRSVAFEVRTMTGHQRWALRRPFAVALVRSVGRTYDKKT
jgi:hypothetical protein